MKTSLLSALIVVNSQEPLPSFQFDEIISPDKEAVYSLQHAYFLYYERQEPEAVPVTHAQCNVFHII